VSAPVKNYVTKNVFKLRADLAVHTVVSLAGDDIPEVGDVVLLDGIEYELKGVEADGALVAPSVSLRERELRIDLLVRS